MNTRLPGHPFPKGQMRSEKTADAIEAARFAQRPSLLHSLFELRFPMEAALFWVQGIHHRWPHVGKNGPRKSVMLIPGFMAGDMSLAPLAGLCRWLGHKTFFTGIRSNSNCPRETLMHLERHLERIHEDEGRVVIIGQSLGGVYARELAARRPELVERVITLGSPIRLVEDSANALVITMARLVSRLRNMDDGCLTQSCSCGMMLAERHPGEVPTTAIYSKTDGVVHWDSCVDRSGAKTVENLEVKASHVGMGVNTEVFKIIASRLASAPRPTSSTPAPIARPTRRREVTSSLP
jgi:triacylglycerol lipase